MESSNPSLGESHKDASSAAAVWMNVVVTSLCSLSLSLSLSPTSQSHAFKRITERKTKEKMGFGVAKILHFGNGCRAAPWMKTSGPRAPILVQTILA